MTESTPMVGPAARTEIDGHILIITLDRPSARNAINAEATQALEAAIDELESTDDLWAAILTGNGPVFCAGADLKTVAAGGLGDLMTERGGFAGFVRRRRTKPVIAALTGDAIAGGMELAIAADLIVAGREVRLGIPEAARSLLAIGGALAELPRLIGEKAALDLALTGQLWPATRLHELGLISRIVDNSDVLDEALALAATICANAPLAVRASRHAIVAGRDLNSAGRWQLAEDQLTILRDTEDYHEGPRAFIEKRPPRWSAQ